MYDPPRVTNPMLYAKRLWHTTFPDLPAYMLRGKRRWTPTRRIKYKHTRSPAKTSRTTKMPFKRSKGRTKDKKKKKEKTIPIITKSMTTTKKTIPTMTKSMTTSKKTPEGLILRTESVIRNGRKMVKVVKLVKKSTTKPLLPVQETTENKEITSSIMKPINITDESQFDISVFGNEIIDSDFLE